MFQAFEDEGHLSFLFEGYNDGAVLLVHGFPGSALEMRPIAEKINQLGWTAKGILLPGFGPEFETLTDKTHQDWLSAVEKGIQELRSNYSTVIVAGNSMGAGLSIQAATRHSVDGLILFAPFWTVDHFLWNFLPVLKHIVPRVKPFRLFKPDFNDPEFQKGTRKFLPNADFDDPDFQRMTLEMEIHTTIFDEIRSVGVGAFKKSREITSPTLIIQGSEDELVTPKQTKKLRERLNTDAVYVEVPAPHNPIQPELGCWEQVTNSVEEFLQRFPVKLLS